MRNNKVKEVFLLFIVFLFCAIYKIIDSFFALYRCEKFKKQYIEYVEISYQVEKNKDDKNMSDKENSLWEIIEENKVEIIKLFNKAGFENYEVPVTVPTGFNHVTHRNVDLYENMTKLISIGELSIPVLIRQTFINAIGVYKYRIRESLNPLYWIDVILFLPQKTLTYLKLNIGKHGEIITRICNTVYWILSVFYVI